MSKKIGVLIGSLRKESFNRKVAEELIALAPVSLKLEIINIDNLSLYNQDLDGKEPAAWLEFRKQIKSCDGLLICTPEYNRSVPGVLKNALDIGSRPYGHSVWAKKPVGVVSVSVSALGGFGANHHLRQTFAYLDMPCMAQPEAYIGNAASLFDENGKMKSESTIKFLQNYINAFSTWVERHA